MPLYEPTIVSNPVTVDAQGFVHIAGTSVPFRYETEILPGGGVRISHIILDDQGQEKTIASIEY